MDIAAEILALLFAAGLIAGWVDAIAGGGGLITLPALMLSGMPPAAAIATNKLQGSAGTFIASSYFLRRGAVSLRENALAVALVGLGSAAGGWAITQINADMLKYLIPAMLILLAFYFLFFAGNLDRPRTPRMSKDGYSKTAAPALGFYDGFFGPGTGSLMAASLVSLRGFDIRRATAHAKLFNFTSNIAALAYFLIFGQIYWLAGAVMIVGQMLGAFLGARIAFHAGAKIIRPLTILTCLAMSGRALWDLMGV